VVSQIKGEHAMMGGELLGNGPPVSPRSEQAVQDCYWWPLAVFG
jgi:hypothetical protein